MGQKEQGNIIIRKRSIKNLCPGLFQSEFEITSPQASDYNCIAWAANDVNNWWDPHLAYWPEGIERELKLNTFIKVFEMLGYQVCDNSKLEKDCVKIAIFVDDNEIPSHAARQLDNGHWTSKLGQIEDIEHHKVEGVEGKYYGKVAVFMKRNKAFSQ